MHRCIRERIQQQHKRDVAAESRRHLTPTVRRLGEQAQLMRSKLRLGTRYKCPRREFFPARQHDVDTMRNSVVVFTLLTAVKVVSAPRLLLWGNYAEFEPAGKKYQHKKNTNISSICCRNVQSNINPLFSLALGSSRLAHSSVAVLLQVARKLRLLHRLLFPHSASCRVRRVPPSRGIRR